MIRIVSALALAGTVAALSGALSWAQTPADTVKARQELMGQLWPNYYRDISQVARGNSTDIAVVATKATGAVDALKKFATLFPPGTGRDAVPTTRTKPDAWTDRAAFDKANNDLIAATAAIGDAAKSGNLEAVKAAWPKVAETCGACHGGAKKAGGKFRFEE